MYPHTLKSSNNPTKWTFGAIRPAIFFLPAIALLVAGCSTSEQQNLPTGTPIDTSPERNSELIDDPTNEIPSNQVEQPPVFLNALSPERSTLISLPGDSNGSASATHLGDIDGDGFDDMALMDYRADLVNPERAGTDMAAGAVWIVYGQANRLPTLNVDEAIAAGESFAITGPDNIIVDEQRGYAHLNSVVRLGDINADGFNDLAVHGRYDNLWIIYGGARRSNPISVNALTAANGFVINVKDTNNFRVNGAGDWNGDGVDDLLIGTVNVNTDEVTGLATGVIVVYGVPGTRDVIDTSALNVGEGVLIGTGIAHAQLGATMTALGDFNADGIDDIAFTAPGRSLLYADYDPGRVFVLYGTTTTQPLVIDIDTLPAANGLTLTQASGLAYIGGGLTAADTNGDGLSDLLIGAYATPDQQDAINYLVHGSASMRPSPASLDTVANANGAILNMASGDFSTRFINDVNGDGVNDMVIESFTRLSIESYVKYRYLSILFTPTGGFANENNLSTLLTTGHGYAIKTGKRDDGGSTIEDISWSVSLSGTGDIDGDGLGDLLLGSRYLLEDTKGLVSVLFGQ